MLIYLFQIIDLPVNNTQHVILPAVSEDGERHVTHKLFRVNGPETDIDSTGKMTTRSVTVQGMYTTETDIRGAHWPNG